MKLDARTILVLFLVIACGALVANLVALKIAADQAGKAVDDLKATSTGSLLGLLK